MALIEIIQLVNIIIYGNIERIIYYRVSGYVAGGVRRRPLVIRHRLQRIESHPSTPPPRLSNHHPPYDTIVIYEIVSSSLPMEPPVPGRTIRSAGRHGYGDIDDDGGLVILELVIVGGGGETSRPSDVLGFCHDVM